MNEKALVPVEQRRVEFYEDVITAVLVEVAGEQQVYVPLRPIADSLGLDWSAQYRRLKRDEVLDSELMSVAILATDIEGTRPKTSHMLCLPLDFLNGWLFGVTANQVRPELKDRITRYRRECYRVLQQAFVSRSPEPEGSATTAVLLQIRGMSTAITRVVDELITIEQRTSTVETRLDAAARVVGEMNKRLTSLERRVTPGETLNKEQAFEVQELVKRIADEMSRHNPGKSHHMEVYRALSLQTKRARYEDIPQSSYELAMQFLENWLTGLLNANQEKA